MNFLQYSVVVAATVVLSSGTPLGMSLPKSWFGASGASEARPTGVSALRVRVWRHGGLEG